MNKIEITKDELIQAKEGRFKRFRVYARQENDVPVLSIEIEFEGSKGTYCFKASDWVLTPAKKYDEETDPINYFATKGQMAHCNLLYKDNLFQYFVQDPEGRRCYFTKDLNDEGKVKGG